MKTKDLSFSFIIPVYNRPNEIRSCWKVFRTKHIREYEIVIVEDGSTITFRGGKSRYLREDRTSLPICKRQTQDQVIHEITVWKGQRAITLLYWIPIVFLPPQYLKEVDRSLTEQFVHCFGGPDAAHESFSNVQKAINYAMTSVFSTGGIRGGTSR